MKLGFAIRQVHGAELDLAEELLKAGERQKADHDVYHITRTLAKRCTSRANALVPFADRYGARIGREDESERGGLLTPLREKGSVLLGRRPEPGVQLIRDLRRVYLAASETSINWVILAQGAQAAKDVELVAAVAAHHADELRVVRWATTRLKTAAPQVLMS